MKKAFYQRICLEEKESRYIIVLFCNMDKMTKNMTKIN